MDPFIRRLIERLHDPSAPLSRNRHFHTFDTPEGRAALKTSRRLKGLQRDLLACAAEGHRASFRVHPLEDGKVELELTLERERGRRVSRLSPAELELLRKLPGVEAALERCGAAAPMALKSA